MASEKLDLSPLPAPVHPLKFAAGQLRQSTYRTVQERDHAVGLIRWLEALAARTIGMESNDPMMIAACGRVAIDGNARAMVLRACLEADALIAEQEGHKPTNGHATTAPALAGFRVDG